MLPPPPRQRRFDCVSILGALPEGQEAMGGHISYSEGEHRVLETEPEKSESSQALTPVLTHTGNSLMTKTSESDFSFIYIII